MTRAREISYKPSSACDGRRLLLHFKLAPLPTSQGLKPWPIGLYVLEAGSRGEDFLHRSG